MKSYNFDIPKEIMTAFEYFFKSGYEAYLVGGCVRDFLMEKKPHDFDMTTNAYPKEIKEIFKDFKIIETGISHGTVTVVINSFHIEITTYRIDGEYEDNRHPKNVIFTRSLTEDLRRRDFTANAVAYNPFSGFCDPFRGEKDIREKRIMCVGKSDIRFNEDGLRILRALRFCSTLGFFIEENTEKSIHKNKMLLKNISAERISEELKKLILGNNIKEVLTKYSDVFSVFLHNASDFKKAAAVIPLLEKDVFLRISALSLCCDINKTLINLKESNLMKSTVKAIVSSISCDISYDKKRLLYFLNKYGADNAVLILKLKLAILQSENKSTDEILKGIHLIEKIIENNECFSLKQLCINGNDLIKLGFSGKEIGTILNKILNLILNGDIINDKSTIISFIKQEFFVRITKN